MPRKQYNGKGPRATGGPQRLPPASRFLRNAASINSTQLNSMTVQLAVFPVLGSGNIDVGHKALVRELVHSHAMREARFGGRARAPERSGGGRVRVPSPFDEVPERLKILEE